VKNLIDIFSLQCAAVVSAPRLWCMVLHFADLKIYIINGSENGSCGFSIHLYDALSVSPAMAVER
jgi:hypothetical protein